MRDWAGMRRAWRLSTSLVLAVAGASCLAAIACGFGTNGLEAVDASTTDSAGPDTSADTVGPQDTFVADTASGSDALDAQPDVVVSDAGDAGPDVLSDAMALCLSLCTAEGGRCEGDAGEQCSIYCTSTNPCQSVQCPPGIPCYADCTGTGACSGGVNCADASSCNIVCGGGSNCGAISCGGTDCTVLCESQGACPNVIDCKATNTCTVDCLAANSCGGAIHSTAQNTTVLCVQPNTCTQNITCGGAQCQVSCGGSGSCSGGECCDAGTCSPQATPLCL